MSRELLLKRMFDNPKHYPYGFSRSGDFSIAESKALSQYGCLIAALVDGLLVPSNDEEKGFIEAAIGKKKPETIAERAWLKYQSRINRPKYGSIYGTQKVSRDDSLDEDSLSDVDGDLDIDID
jgi:uncharacterized protein YifE (UPF0438 family)